MRRFLSIVFIGFFLSLILWPSATAWTDVEHLSIFRYSGDGVIGMQDIQTKEFFNVIYRNRNGHYDDEALVVIDHIFRCHGQQEKFPISLKLIELIDHIQDHFDAKEVRIISGYRSPSYNAKLKARSRRVARESLHMEGMAADIIIPGVSAARLRDYAKSLRAGGVGYYGANAFVHIDIGEVRHW